MSLLFALIVIVLFLFVFAATMSSILYWYETINTPCEEIPSPKPGFVACAQVFAFSLAGYFIGVFSYPVGFFWKRTPTPLTPETAGAKPPIVLIHGINDNSSALLALYYRLQKEGYPVFTFSYFSLFVSVETTLSRFDDFVHMVEASYPGRKPMLIGHSLGGIFIRRRLMQAENQLRALGVITLATPHGGSKMAVFAPGRLAKLILPSSKLIAELKAAGPVESLPCVSLVSPIDEAVLPAASLLPPKGWKMRVTSRASHFTMLYCSCVFADLLEELKAIEAGFAPIPTETTAPETEDVSRETMAPKGKDASREEVTSMKEATSTEEAAPKGESAPKKKTASKKESTKP